MRDKKGISNHDKICITVDVLEELDLEPGLAVAIDFDGVIHRYRKGWLDGTIYDSINVNALNVIKFLQLKHIPVFILSSRPKKDIYDWFRTNYKDIKVAKISNKVKFWEDTEVIGITNTKLPAQLYIDDRAYKWTKTTKLIDFINRNMTNNRYYDTLGIIEDMENN